MLVSQDRTYNWSSKLDTAVLIVDVIVKSHAGDRPAPAHVWLTLTTQNYSDN